MIHKQGRRRSSREDTHLGMVGGGIEEVLAADDGLHLVGSGDPAAIHHDACRMQDHLQTAIKDGCSELSALWRLDAGNPSKRVSRAAMEWLRAVTGWLLGAGGLCDDVQSVRRAAACTAGPYMLPGIVAETVVIQQLCTSAAELWHDLCRVLLCRGAAADSFIQFSEHCLYTFFVAQYQIWPNGRPGRPCRMELEQLEQS